MAVTRRTVWLLDELRRAVGQHADDTVRTLTKAWVGSWDAIAGEWEAGVNDLITLVAETGTWPAPWRIARLQRLNRAEILAQQALTALAAEAAMTTGAGITAVVAATAAAEPEIMGSQLPAILAKQAIARYAAAVAPSALEAIAIRCRQQVTQVLWPLADTAVRAMRRALVVGVAVGDNPKITARDMLRRCEGNFNGGLARATNVARTETLDAYRATSAQVHAANADVLEGWRWHSSLDRRTCFPAGTWITTRAGQVPIEAVCVGDEVLTHTGDWRRVYETLEQSYEGPMVTVEAGPLRVTATADHPFLIERQRKLQWVEAQHIRRGDSVLSDRESGPHGIGHAGNEGSVERGCDQPDDGPTEALHVQGLAGVAVCDLGVPVRFVYLDRGLPADEEVNRTLPTGHDGLLLVVDAQRAQGAADVAFGHGFAGVPSVATNRTEPGVAHAGDHPELFSACSAVDRDGWAAADLRTVGMTCSLGGEDGAAAGAGSVSGVGAGAVDRTVFVSVDVADWDAERLAATGAGFLDLGGAGVAAARAVAARVLPAAGTEGASAAVAVPLDAGDGGSAAAAVGIFPLVGGVTGATAELSPALPVPCGGNLVRGAASRTDLLDLGIREFGSMVVGATRGAVFALPAPTVELGPAPLTSQFKRHTVSNVQTHIQATRVYNVEVEIDHSYVANGFAVHNCPSCWAMHGTIHPVTQAGPWDHQSGRCCRLPLLKSWVDLGIPGIEDPDLTPSAAARFAELPEADQLVIMGPARLALLNAGRITFADIPMRRETPGWRPSYVPRTVEQLRLIAGRADPG